MEDDIDIGRIREGLREGSTISISLATLVSVLVTILLASLGYLFITTSTHQTKLAVVERDVHAVVQRIESLIATDKENSILLREIREDQIRRQRGNGR
jgi:hypothetical protein